MNYYIKPTERCNLSCLHCYNCSGVPNKEIGIVKQAEKLNVEHIRIASRDNWCILHGGEPLLMLRYEDFKQAKTTIHFPTRWRITSNLTLPLTEDRIKILQELDDIRTSFDLKIRFGTFRNLLRWYHNSKQAIRIKPTMVNICLTKQLLKENPVKVIQVMQKMGFYAIAFEPLSVKGTLKQHKDIVPSYLDIEKWLIEVYKARSQYQIRILNFEDIQEGIVGNVTGKERSHRAFSSCCSSTLVINADGTLGGCPNCAREMHMPKIKQRLMMCRACDFYGICQGGCPEQEWQDDICPYPKKLATMIQKDLHLQE